MTGEIVVVTREDAALALDAINHALLYLTDTESAQAHLNLVSPPPSALAVLLATAHSILTEVVKPTGPCPHDKDIHDSTRECGCSCNCCREEKVEHA